ncbi:MAG: TetR family transcriptional regulator [Rhizobiaceae bacterium]|nr:TetR family transcriptional regulator [Rhizobiaceae bacterium]
MRPSKREELIEKSLFVFDQNGFHATGMDLLSAEIGMSKTSIYNHFRTKEDLIVEVLRLQDEQFRNWLLRRMYDLGTANHGGPREQLLAMFDALDEWFNHDNFNGCLFLKATGEYSDHEHPIHRQAIEHAEMFEIQLLALVKKASLRLPELVTRQLLILKDGAVSAAQVGHINSAAKDARYAAQCLIDTHDTSKRKPVQTSFAF